MVKDARTVKMATQRFPLSRSRMVKKKPMSHLHLVAKAALHTAAIAAKTTASAAPAKNKNKNATYAISRCSLRSKYRRGRAKLRNHPRSMSHHQPQKKNRRAAPINTTGYIMHTRAHGAQPATPTPLTSFASPRLEAVGLGGGGKPPPSGIDQFGSYIGNEEDVICHHTEEQHLLRVLEQQAQKIVELEAALREARQVCPPATPHDTIASRIASLL